MQTRFVEMYSLIPWDSKLRRMFSLGYDPYFYEQRTVEGVAADRARELLSSIGCFYYRDSENGQSSVMLKPTCGTRYEEITGKHVIFENPLTCYFFSAHVAYPGIIPLDHVPPRRIAEATKYEEFRAKWGDTKQWLHWNEQREIIEIAPGHIRHKRTQPVILPNAEPITMI